MRSAPWKLLCVILCTLVFGSMASAQDPDSPGTPKADMSGAPGRKLDVGTTELGVWMGYSPDNPTWINRNTDPYFQVSVQYARVLTTGDDWALKYTAQIVPVAMIRQLRQGSAVNGNNLDSVALPSTKQKIYGAGVTPVGLQMNFRRDSVLQPYVDATAGVLFFSDEVPVADSSKFNFSFDFGGGVEIWYLENRSVSIGYKRHHISNGYIARRNPGVNSNLFYVGCAWSWRQ